MKAFLLSLLATLGQASASGMLRLSDHTDITPVWNTSTSTWSWSLLATSTNTSYAPGVTYFPVRDLPAGTGSGGALLGDRYSRNASSNFNFIGVAAGEPVWILPLTNNGQAWPGFGDTQPGTFASYTETDTRVSGAAPWLRFQLTGVDGPTGGFFSLFNNSTQVWMRTDNGINSSDVYIKPLSHAHTNWCFSKKGLWRVRMTVTGFRGPGATNPTPPSPELSLYFAIGAFAEWRASRFSGPDSVNPAIGADLADPDQDGVNNLLEYASGGNPLVNSALREGGGDALAPVVGSITIGSLTYPTFTYHRRKASTVPDITYTTEWQSGLSTSGWSAGGTVVSTQNLDATWEKITVRDTSPISGSTGRFCRLKITSN
jgi:surface-anchored protein